MQYLGKICEYTDYGTFNFALALYDIWSISNCFMYMFEYTVLRLLSTLGLLCFAHYYAFIMLCFWHIYYALFLAHFMYLCNCITLFVLEHYTLFRAML